jgi:molecular chaperone GrpE
LSDKHAHNSENPAVEDQTAQTADGESGLEQDISLFEETSLPNEMGPSPEEQIEELQNQITESKDRMLRLMAEFENYKKRTQKEKEGLATEVKASCVLTFLPVLDNLERALTHKGTEEGSLAEGIELVVKQFYESLSRLGVTEIEALGKPFDPQMHNAVAHVEDDTQKANIVAEVFEKGFCIKDKIIRHSMVKVAN